MRNRIDGSRPAARWPVGHLGWVFTGRAEFEGRAGSFLAEGGARGERLIFIADDPKASLWPKHLVDRGSLLLLSISELYGTERLVATAQRAAYEATVDDAISLGYTGVRVAADCTSLISGSERFEAWLRWEDEADRMVQERPINALCAFDRTRSDAASLRALANLHGARPPRLSRPASLSTTA